jgi:gamma-polyglutamate synthase
MWLTASSPFLLFLSLWAGLIAYLHWEKRRHERALHKIPLRIQVNGTRGKSSVSRLIAAGLRSGGIAVFAKTTGTSPRLIRPDGSEERIERRGPANIRENLAFVRRAAEAEAEAVVVECMALRPDLQRVLEHRMLKSHIGVITNIRPDHEDIMGEGVAALGKALAQSIPGAGLLVTAPESAKILSEAGVIIDASRLRHPPQDLPEEYSAGFGYEIFPDNVALALAVCELCGVARTVAIEGMRSAAPDKGNVGTLRFEVGDKTVTFINAFAANDPESTMLLWERYVGNGAQSTIVLMNPRHDRKYRTRQLCRLFGIIHRGLLLVTRDSRFVTKQLQPFAGIRVAAASRKECLRMLQEVVRETPGPRVTVFAAGNVQGMEPLLAEAAVLASQGGDVA